MTYIDSDTVSTRFRPVIAPSASAHRSGHLVGTRDALVLLAKEPLAKEFGKHKKKWLNDTRHLSSPVDRYMHPSYVRIIGLGPDVIGLLLADLKAEQNDWFYALQFIVGDCPITSSMAGDFRQMRKAWLEWGEAHDYI